MQKKNALDYFSFGMPMPARKMVNGIVYRYAFQGQELDPETGKEAFQLRLWDSRIGRWTSIDPKNQYFSPYLGMGNNQISRIDPDGGCDHDGTEESCPEEHIYTETIDEVVLTNLTRDMVPRDFAWTNDMDWNYENWQSYKHFWQNQFKGFAAEFDAGWKNWDPNGLGNFWMNFTTVAVSMPLLMTNPATAAMFTQTTTKMSIDATLQYAITGDIDYADVLISGPAKPGTSVILGMFIDVTTIDSSVKVNIFGIHGDKPAKQFLIDGVSGVIGYGTGKYSSALNKNQFINPSIYSSMLENTLIGAYSTGFGTFLTNTGN